jgi:hypothetical protein
MPTLFSEVSEVVTIGRDNAEAKRFGAAVHPKWSIAGKPSGGYLLSLLGRAAVTASPHPHVLAASAYYLRPPEPGRVMIEVHLLRAGRSATHLRATMSQGGEVCVEALAMAGDLDTATPTRWDRGVPSAGTANYPECMRLGSQLPDGSRVEIRDQIEVRLEPASAGFTRGAPSGRGELRGWLGLPGEEAFDPISLLLAVDAFPPATFDIKFSGWVPTLELTVYVRALPKPGPVRLLQRAELIDDGRVDESCYVWDRSGRLVAQGRQLAAIRLA